jgi:hypothetical protein
MVRVYGKKIKQIARETGHSKNTIKRLLREEYNGYNPRVEPPIDRPVKAPGQQDRWLGHFESLS